MEQPSHITLTPIEYIANSILFIVIAETQEESVHLLMPTTSYRNSLTDILFKQRKGFRGIYDVELGCLVLVPAAVRDYPERLRTAFDAHPAEELFAVAYIIYPTIKKKPSALQAQTPRVAVLSAVPEQKELEHTPTWKPHWPNRSSAPKSSSCRPWPARRS